MSRYPLGIREAVALRAGKPLPRAGEHPLQERVTGSGYAPTTGTVQVPADPDDARVFGDVVESWVSTFRWNRRNNPLLWVGLGTECVALLAFIYLPVFQEVFSTVPPTEVQWLLLLFCPALLLTAEELRKLWIRKR
ncbi:cation transporting ATPase C-terminal domain-containing protein [Thermostichus vulcanus]|uniref:Cation transporting ATPase C-terminal domain-containing protein n=1 Tax=Thermostichus vulcanus str. 'Rupite' TaxID=2813851 RepID=A0ABT0CBD5_THEVL|nr:cation-translocating P-type ATPase C-terminal domain-containing protein [Thermostichus vulcanus]MCJ2543096.1 cation transporting ATPase C-terminal domain-containing protein [Thermostichus vulcanus str. 'Rupite']